MNNGKQMIFLRQSVIESPLHDTLKNMKKSAFQKRYQTLSSLQAILLLPNILDLSKLTSS